MRDGHVHHDAIEPLDLVRVDADHHRDREQAPHRALLAFAIPKRARRGKLRLDNSLDDLQPFCDQLDDLSVDQLDPLAQTDQIRGRHGTDSTLSWASCPPTTKTKPSSCRRLWEAHCRKSRRSSRASSSR